MTDWKRYAYQAIVQVAADTPAAVAAGLRDIAEDIEGGGNNCGGDFEYDGHEGENDYDLMGPRAVPAFSVWRATKAVRKVFQALGRRR